MKNVIKKFSRELEVVAALAVIMVVFGVIPALFIFRRLTCLISWTSPLSMVFWLSA